MNSAGHCYLWFRSIEHEIFTICLHRFPAFISFVVVQCLCEVAAQFRDHNMDFHRKFQHAKQSVLSKKLESTA